MLTSCCNTYGADSTLLPAQKQFILYLQGSLRPVLLMLLHCGEGVSSRTPKGAPGVRSPEHRAGRGSRQAEEVPQRGQPRPLPVQTSPCFLQRHRPAACHCVWRRSRAMPASPQCLPHSQRQPLRMNLQRWQPTARAGGMCTPPEIDRQTDGSARSIADMRSIQMTSTGRASGSTHAVHNCWPTPFLSSSSWIHDLPLPSHCHHHQR